MSSPSVTILIDRVATLLLRMASCAPPSSHMMSSTTPFFSDCPSLTLPEYLHERFEKFSQASDECYIVAMLLVHRWGKITGMLNPHTVHRVTLTSFLIAVKMHEDFLYTDRYYSKVGGVDVADLISMERQFLRDIQWRLWVDPTWFRTCLMKICAPICGPSSVLKASSDSTPKQQQQQQSPTPGGEIMITLPSLPLVPMVESSRPMMMESVVLPYVR